MEDKKIVFIDCDNTLIAATEEGAEFVPESARKALEMAKEKGVLIYLCTGRSLVEITETVNSLPLDGIIGSSGAYIVDDGKLVYLRTMEEEDVRKIGGFLKEKDIAFMYESNHGVYANRKMKEYYSKDLQASFLVALMEDIEMADLTDINKICYLSADLTADELSDMLDNQYDVVSYSYSNKNYGGEISTKNVNKGSGVRILMEMKGIPFENSYSIGDSHNDIEMFKNTNKAAVVGNCVRGLEAYADYKSTDIDEDGVYNIFKHYELI